MPIDVGATLLGLDALAARINEAARQITADAAHMVQRKAMDVAPVGVSGNSTNAPGDLRRSILVQGPVGADGRYEAQVGPTVVYGRQRELGGPIYAQNVSYLVFTKFGTTYYTPRVFQKPRPYMKPGRMLAIPGIEAMAQERVAAAIVSGG